MGAACACYAPAPRLAPLASHALTSHAPPLARLPNRLPVPPARPPDRPDKEGLACAVCLDQTLRVFIVTKLNKL